ncbi:hypothetical protein RIF29_30202 [Crotalaria pallida]|uniref:Uncharacterized protein n=1 Tax=Crotalaria pallida TaxID=3830 RepID=A0AAN9EGP8_CROPI
MFAITVEFTFTSDLICFLLCHSNFLYWSHIVVMIDQISVLIQKISVLIQTFLTYVFTIMKCEVNNPIELIELSSNEASFRTERLFVNIILVQILKHEWPAKLHT